MKYVTSVSPFFKILKEDFDAYRVSLQWGGDPDEDDKKAKIKLPTAEEKEQEEEEKAMVNLEQTDAWLKENVGIDTNELVTNRKEYPDIEKINLKDHLPLKIEAKIDKVSIFYCIVLLLILILFNTM